MKSEVYKRNVGIRDELLSRIMDLASCIKGSKYQARRKTRDLRTRVEKGVEVDGGIFENSSRTVIDLPFLCKEFVI